MATMPESAPRTWFPLAFVIVALACLLAIPIIATTMIARARANVLDPANEARLLVGDFARAFTNELLLVTSRADTALSSAGARATAQAAEQTALRSLSPVVAQLGGESVQRLAALRAAERRWRESISVIDATRATRGLIDGHEVLNEMDSLYQYFVDLAEGSRQRVRRLERLDVFLSALLTTLALIAIAVVVRLDRKLRRYAHEASDRAYRLERSVELRATLINGVVHDVKNPLGAASGYAELLADGLAGPLSKQQEEMVGRIKRLLGTAQQTVTELVELARVDAGEFPIERESTRLSSIIQQIVEDYQGQAIQKGISVTFARPPHEPTLTTDPIRVRHVVENLVSNALKYTPEGGRIRVSIDTSSRKDIRVDVSDTGPGIPADLRERIFEPFFRGPAESATPGSGLGLTISRRIARLLGGDVTVHDAPGRGSVFSLTLPLDQSRTPAQAA